MAYKVFTNGSVLQASEVNDNLMRQSVMVFSNAAARTAAITAPLEGMLTWLEDVNIYQYYNGSAWVTASQGMGGGLVHIQSQSVSGVTSIIFNNVFSSLYRNYKIVLDGVMASNGVVSTRLRAAGVDASGANYSYSRILRDNTSLSSDYTTGQTAGIFGFAGTVGTINNFEIGSPFLATQTTHSSTVSILGAAGLVNNWVIAGAHTLATSYDGISVLPQTSFTGTVSIYGYRV